MTAPNPLRGEAPLGPDHLLRVNFNGFCSLEALTGMEVPALLTAMQKGLGHTKLRYFVRAFVVGDLSDLEAGELIDAVGLEATMEALRVGIESHFTPPSKDKSTNPLKAAAA